MHVTTDFDQISLDIQYDSNKQEVWLSVKTAFLSSIVKKIVESL